MIPPLGKTERLLRRFSRTGDPRALGLLFDRTAPELLRTALWLCRNQNDAEDLLQRTFLTVIEARGNYDSSRRALPWLCGILGNHARKLHDKRERERDQRRRLTEVADVGPKPAPSPIDAASGREIVEIVNELRGELGSPYREVLDLHLGRGLKPVEIAAELDREAGTVRTQLVRGMAQLRERLPLTLFAPMVAAALLTTGSASAQLAKIRATILRRAGTATPVAVGATIAAKHVIAALAAGVALSVAALWIWAALARAPFAPVTEVAAATTAAAAQETGEGPAAEPDRAPVGAPNDNSPAEAPGTKRVAGRVIDADGRAIPHATLWLSEINRAIAGTEYGQCDAAGRFTIATEAGRYLGAHHEGHVGSLLHWLGTAGDELTLRLRGPSASVSGRVFDAAGRPAGGAQIAFGVPGGWRVANTTHERVVYPPRRSGRTDAEGRFEVDGIEPGRVDLSIRAAGHSPLPTEAFVQPGPNGPLVFRLQRGATVAGRACDDRRTAAAGATIVASNARGEVGRTTADDNGDYVLADLPAGNLQLTANIGAAIAAHAVELAVGASSRWDPVLLPGSTLAGKVVDRRQQPVAGIEVLVGPPTMMPDAPATTTSADGTFQLSAARARATELYLRRGTAPLAVRRVATGEQVQVELADHELPNARISGRVVDHAGKPVAAAISVMHHAFLVVWYAYADPATGQFNTGPIAPGDYTLAFEAAGFGRTPMRVANVRSSETRALGDITLQPAGRVELELLADVTQQRKAIKFTRIDGVVVSFAVTLGRQVTAELPPGRYVASVLAGDYRGSKTTLTVQSGETTRSELPCTPTALVTLQLQLLDTRPAGTRVDARVVDASGDFFDAYEFFVGRDEQYEAELGLPPGSYRIDFGATDGRTATLPVTVQSPTEEPMFQVELR